MPHLKIPSYCHHKATGQAVVRINKKDFYLGKHGSPESQRKFQELIGKFLTGDLDMSSQQQSNEASTPELSVVELISQYWIHCCEYYRKDGKPTSELAIVKTALRQLRLHFGRVPISEFGPKKLKALRKFYIDEGLKRPTVNKYVSRVVMMFRWAASNELIPITVHQALTTVRSLQADRCDAAEPDPVEPVADKIVERTLPDLPPIVADMVIIQRLTGARPGEICNLKPIDLNRDGDVWEYRPASHKTTHHGKDRVIFIGPKAQQLLAPYLSRDQNSYCFSPKESEEKRRKIRHENRATPIGYGNAPGTNRVSRPKRVAGNCYTTATYRQVIQRACERAGIEKWSPNQLRHSAGTEARKEFGIEAASVMLGHARTSTSEIYAEKNRQLAATVVKKLG